MNGPGASAGGGTASVAGRAPSRLAVARFALECGAVLRDVVQAYHLDGALAPDGRNLVLVFHALTGSADAAGPATGWWRDVIGPGGAVDTRRWAVLCPNLLGSCYGTTWGGVEWNGVAPDPATGAPPITTRDQARLAARAVAALGVSLGETSAERGSPDDGAIALVAGGSLGGMVALEWAAEYPRSARAVVALAAPAAHPPWAVAWNHLQRAALDLAGPGREAEGLALARQVAMLSYRTSAEFEARFGRDRDVEGRPAVAGYLERHGARLVARFDPSAYRTLLGAMDAHDVGRGRGGVGPALRGFAGRLVAVGVPGDVLYDAALVRAWAREAGARYEEVRSLVGHDAFLVEGGQVGAILHEALGEVGGDPPADGETLETEHAWAR